MSNPMDEIGRFRDDIDRMSQRFEQAQAALGPVTGEDGTRSVSVTLDAAGLVSDVRVGRGWADHLTADTLGSAVSEAIAGALGSRTQQWATEALRDAYRQIATTSTRSIIDASPLGRLRELTDDPVALARRLHLRD